MSSFITPFSETEISHRAIRAHEMKNCMSVILAVSRLVERELSQQSRARMDRLQSALRRLRDLLTEDLSAEMNRAYIVAPASLSCVTTLVNATVARLEDRAADAQVELFVQCGGGELFCDEGALGEALFNLVANAIEATPAGGAVLVATYTTNADDQNWVIQDTGNGIPADRLAEVGRPFQSTKGGGSGLGLALARAAVAAHGGMLRVESCVGAGTTVSVWLPRRPPAAAP